MCNVLSRFAPVDSESAGLCGCTLGPKTSAIFFLYFEQPQCETCEGWKLVSSLIVLPFRRLNTTQADAITEYVRAAPISEFEDDFDGYHPPPSPMLQGHYM